MDWPTVIVYWKRFAFDDFIALGCEQMINLNVLRAAYFNSLDYTEIWLGVSLKTNILWQKAGGVMKMWSGAWRNGGVFDDQIYFKRLLLK